MAMRVPSLTPHSPIRAKLGPCSDSGYTAPPSLLGTLRTRQEEALVERWGCETWCGWQIISAHKLLEK